MTEKQYRMKKLSAVCSLDAYRFLDQYLKDRAKTPYPLSVENTFYRKTNHREYLSKFIESVIMRLLRDLGASSIKAPDKGIFRDGKWTPNFGVKRGRADVICFVWGQMYNFEVKVRKDSQKDEQRAEQQRAEANGEKYVIIKTVDDFLRIYKENVK